LSLNNQDRFVFLPLGGAGEIGMNLNLYGFGPPGKEKWIMIDLGITFNNGSMTGIDVIMPDPVYIEKKRKNLLGLILTHAHEDHLGAVPYLWSRLKCPIYATPFTAGVLETKLIESEYITNAKINIVKLNGEFKLEPFKLKFVTLTHSIPEPSGIIIKTPIGTVFHTGDWKLDPNPVSGPPSNQDELRKLGNKGVMAIVCDSTNVFDYGHSGSESDLLKTLSNIISNCPGKIAISCFSSNVARLETISTAAKKNGRAVGIVGRSLQRIEKIARNTGYLKNTPPFLKEDQINEINDSQLLIICTGSQGEPRAALTKILTNQHRTIKLSDKDTIIFSSRIIPGNEVSVNNLYNLIASKGIKSFTSKDHLTHVSGHPGQDDLKKMYELIKPKVSIPVHGEFRHLIEHSRLALKFGASQAVIVKNGDLINLSEKCTKIIKTVEVGRLSLDGSRLIELNSEIYKSKKRAMWHGTATLTIGLNTVKRKVFSPQVATTGLFENEKDPILIQAIEIANVTAQNALETGLKNDKKIAENIRIAIRKHFKIKLGKRPITTIHLVQVE